jgi:hypothetical protein
MASARLIVAAVVIAFVAGCGGGSDSTAPSMHAAHVETPAATVGAAPAAHTTKGPRGRVRPRKARVVAAVPPGAPPKRVPVRVPKAGDKSIQTFGEAASEVDYVTVANTVRAFALARASGDVESACALLASGMKDQLMRFFAMAAAHSKSAAKPPTCVTAVGQMFKAQAPDYAKQLRALRVTDARIKGDRGFAIFRMPGIQEGSFPVQREKGGWRVASLAGVQLN